MKYTDSHDWIRFEEKGSTIGISDYAQKELGEIVYIELPRVGSRVKKGEEIVILESTKAAADIYAPIDGTVLEINDKLLDNPELINEDPEESGWIYKLKVESKEILEELLDSPSYKKLVETL